MHNTTGGLRTVAPGVSVSTRGGDASVSGETADGAGMCGYRENVAAIPGLSRPRTVLLGMGPSRTGGSRRYLCTA